MAGDALALLSPGSIPGFPLLERRAYLGASERQRLPALYANLTAERLTTILQQLQRGEVDQWAELVQYALRSDDLLIHLYTTRITRVAQADFQIVPNEFGDQRMAKLAAEFINEMVGRVENWEAFVRNALHAIALGFSANEIEWDRDGVSGITYARNLHYINPNRFRYDDQWKLRLYDHGTRTQVSRDMYGEVLWPANWVIHKHHEVAGNPCDAGLMIMSIWRWLFRRWTDTFWIQNLEKYGSPFVTAEVTANTPLAVRQAIKEAIVDLGIERAAVIEAGGKITITPPPMGTGQASQHELYMDFAKESLTATWLGASDVTSPGENGSQAAVGGRISATTDPRMITDGTEFCGTLHQSLFKWLIQYNAHKFERMPPIPQMQFKTASDEVKTDAQDLASQNAADAAGGNAAAATTAPYEVRGDDGSPSLDGTLHQPAALPADTNAQPTDAVTGQPVEKKQDTALNGAQVTSLLEVIQSVVDGQLPRDSAVVIIETAFNIPTATAQRMLGTVGTSAFTPATDPAAAAAAAPPPATTAPPEQEPPPQPPAEASLPKALGRSNQGRQQTSSAAMTLQTSSRSIGPLENVLKNMSAAPRR